MCVRMLMRVCMLGSFVDVCVCVSYARVCLFSCLRLFPWSVSHVCFRMRACAFDLVLFLCAALRSWSFWLTGAACVAVKHPFETSPFGSTPRPRHMCASSSPAVGELALLSACLRALSFVGLSRQLRAAGVAVLRVPHTLRVLSPSIGPAAIVRSRCGYVGDGG